MPGGPTLEFAESPMRGRRAGGSNVPSSAPSTATASNNRSACWSTSKPRAPSDWLPKSLARIRVWLACSWGWPTCSRRCTSTGMTRAMSMPRCSPFGWRPASVKFAYDSASPNVFDEDGFRREAEQAKRLGYVGKSCVHPTQVAWANEGFRIDELSLATARRIVAAAKGAAELRRGRLPSRWKNDRPAGPQARPGHPGRSERRQPSLLMATMLLATSSALSRPRNSAVYRCPRLGGRGEHLFGQRRTIASAS